MKTIAEALAELNAQENIADFLEAGGYKMPVYKLDNFSTGPEAPCYSCPVALYVTAVCGREADVACVHARFVGQQQSEAVPLPMRVREFISRFDADIFPQLKTLVPRE